MYYPDEVIEEVRSSNNIVDVIGSYVRLQKKRAVPILDFVLFTMRNHHHFLSAPTNRCIIVLAAEQAANVFTFIMEYENQTFPGGYESAGGQGRNCTSGG